MRGSSLRIHRFTPLVFASFVLASSSTALAQKASSQAAAQALFEEGRKLMNAGKYAQACPKLADSQRLDPGAGTLINLAACYEKNGQLASAWATYKEAISESEKSNRPEWAQKSRQRAAALEANLPRLVVNVPDTSKVAGLVVKRDGAEVGSGEWGVPIPVDSGSHAIDASAPGRKAWHTTVEIGKSKESVPVTVPGLEAEPVATAPDATKTSPTTPKTVEPPHERESGGSGQRTLGLVLGGVGVVGLGVGAVFGLQAIAKRNDAKQDCTPDLSKCNQRGVDAIDSAKGKATISTIGMVAGGALLAGGLVLFLTAPKSTEVSGLRLHLGAAEGGFGASLGGAFR